MTTLEITIIVLLAVIAIIITNGVALIVKKLNRIAEQHKSTWSHFDNVVSQLYDIKVEVGQTNAKIDGFIPAFKKLLEHNESIENFWSADSSLVIKLLKEIRNCLTEDINWGELTDNQKSEILYRLTHPVVESPFKPPFNPTCETTNKED